MPAPKNNENAKKYTQEQIDELVEKLKDYISETEIPIVAEFAYITELPRSTLYSISPVVSALLKRLIDKKEYQLERMALENNIDKTMAIFSLKQLGWKDKQEHELSTKDSKPLEFKIVDAD